MARLILLAALAAAAIDAHAANGCSASFSDRRSQNLVVITATNPSVFDYSPRCVRVAAGATLRFDLDKMHPTYGGTVVNDMPTIDPASPIGPWTDTGSYSVILNEAGEFPYFCDVHYLAGMKGSILVVPETFADGFE